MKKRRISVRNMRVTEEKQRRKEEEERQKLQNEKSFQKWLTQKGTTKKSSVGGASKEVKLESRKEKPATTGRLGFQVPL